MTAEVVSGRVGSLGRDGLRAALGAPPSRRPFSGARAAVAAVFRPGAEGVELLFIERARKDTDPWSGQMAFPGGRCEPDDADDAATAARETLEEVGLDLGPAERIGRFHDVDGGRATNRPITVGGVAYWLEGPRPQLTPNYEVADVVWTPLADIADPSRHIDYEYPARPGMTWPGVVVGRPHQVVWGLTLRLLGDLFGRLRVPFVIGPPGPNT